jgi:hypothetical protein
MENASNATGETTVARPRWWDWATDGDSVDGTFVRFDQGHTKQYGPKVIVVLLVSGEERSVWLLETVLHNKFKRELEGRPERNLKAGERVVVTRLDMRESESGGTNYRDFRVLFPDRPAPSAMELFELDGPTVEPTSEPADADDIPF